MPFIDETLEADSLVRYDYVQGATAPEMLTNFRAYITRLQAENIARGDAELPLLNVFDVQLAGAGDGSTFVVSIGVSTSDGVWAAADLDDMVVAFWTGGDYEALAANAVPALAGITDSFNLVGVAAGHAGSAKGTFFMAYLVAIQQNPVPQ